MSFRSTLLLGVSALAHAAVLAGSFGVLAPSEREPVAEVATIGRLALHRVEVEVERARVHEARRELVACARRDLAAKKFALGEFLIRAGTLDAREQGRMVDLAAVRAKYSERLGALEVLLERGDVREAAPAVFGDLRYFGRPGGTMADALLERGGSCEPLSQLAVATAYDARRGDEVALRYYGGGAVPHLAAVAFAYDGDAWDEWDLATGRPAQRGGVRMAPEELVEVYARAHDLAAHVDRGAPGPGEAGSQAAKGADLPTMAAGYPANQDRFDGAVPLFAAHAFAAPSHPRDGGLPAIDGSDMARECAQFLHLGVLDPPSVMMRPDLDVEPRRAPSPADLERKASWIRGVEDFAARRDSDDADRLMSLSCLATLGDSLAVDLALAGETALASVAQKKATKALDDATQLLAHVPWEKGEGAAVRARLGEHYAGRVWLLAALPGGSEIVLEVLGATPQEDPSTSLAALVVEPHTRARAISMVSRLPRIDQVAVMQQMFEAHDSLAPWIANYELDDDPADVTGATFRRAYKVFRAMAYRAFASPMPVAETIAAFDREADLRGLDDDWRAVLLSDYGRNALNAAAQRPDGMASVRALDAALARRKHPLLQRLLRRVREIEASGRIDADTLSEAYRIQ